MANYQLAISNIAWHKGTAGGLRPPYSEPVLPDWRSLRPIFPGCPTKPEWPAHCCLAGISKPIKGFLSCPACQSICGANRTSNIFLTWRTPSAYWIITPPRAFPVYPQPRTARRWCSGCPKAACAPWVTAIPAAEAFFMQAGNLARAVFGVRHSPSRRSPMYASYSGLAPPRRSALSSSWITPGLAVSLDLSTMLAQNVKSCRILVDDLKLRQPVCISTNRAWPHPEAPRA